MTQDLLLKFKFFQDIRMWPKNADFDYEGWLENFSQDEQKIAQKILDFFVYFPDDIIDQMFSEKFTVHVKGQLVAVFHL